jgi:hypothetical protein
MPDTLPDTLTDYRFLTQVPAADNRRRDWILAGVVGAAALLGAIAARWFW